MRTRVLGWAILGLLVGCCGSSQDGGNQDAGPGDVGSDLGQPDVGTPDAGQPDTGTPDAGRLDVGFPDTGTPDAGQPETGVPDTGPVVDVVDAGPPDTGPEDAGMCMPDRGNCDGLASNGCETDLNTSANHCGGCGIVCPSGQACVAGACGSATALAAGTAHSCMVRGGRVFCWGFNLLPDDAPTRPTQTTDAFRVDSVRGATEVATNGNFSCALINQRVSCWGQNNSGQLGANLAITNDGIFNPTEVVGISDATAIATGSGFACAIRAQGRLACWGVNLANQLGDSVAETVANSATPNDLPSLTNIRQVSLSGHACAVNASGQVYCWGSNVGGGVGGTGDRVRVPRLVDGVSNAVSVAVGIGYTVAALSDGTVSCWGDNSVGQCGARLRGQSRIAPGAIAGLTDIVSVTAGVYSACALQRSGQVYCWGTGTRGELGNGQMSFTNADPTAVMGLSDAERLVGFPSIANVAGNHRCVLRRTATQRVFCWGLNNYGQLGDGTTTDRAAPVRSTTHP